MKPLVLITVLSLTGCAGALAPVANWFDQQDSCQTKSRPAGTPPPSYCGAASGHSVAITRGIGPNTYLVNVK